MSVRVNVYMSKVMCMPIKVGVPMYVTYNNCQTLWCITVYVENV